MKKYLKSDKNQLNTQLLKNYGVDLELYKKPEIINKIGEIMMFPQYVVKYISLPIILSFLLYGSSFIIFSFEGVGLVVYILLGWMLFNVAGVFAGIIYLISKIKSDVRLLIAFSFEITIKVLNDTSNIGEKLMKRPSAVGEIFKGIILVVVVPSLTEALANQIPLLGGIFNKIIQKSLIAVSNKLKFSELTYVENKNETEVKNKYLNIIEKTQQKSDLIINRIFSSLQVPFKIILCILISILIGLIFITKL